MDFEIGNGEIARLNDDLTLTFILSRSVGRGKLWRKMTGTDDRRQTTDHLVGEAN